MATRRKPRTRQRGAWAVLATADSAILLSAQSPDLMLQEWEHALKEHGSVKSLRPPVAPGSRKEALRSLADLAAKDPMVDL